MTPEDRKRQKHCKSTRLAPAAIECGVAPSTRAEEAAGRARSAAAAAAHARPFLLVHRYAQLLHALAGEAVGTLMVACVSCLVCCSVVVLSPQCVPVGDGDLDPILQCGERSAVRAVMHAESGRGVVQCDVACVLCCQICCVCSGYQGACLREVLHAFSAGVVKEPCSQSGSVCAQHKWGVLVVMQVCQSFC